MRNLLTLDDGQSCRETRLMAEMKLSIIERRLVDLSRMRKTLKALIAECESGYRPRSCPIIATCRVVRKGSADFQHLFNAGRSPTAISTFGSFETAANAIERLQLVQERKSYKQTACQ